MRRFLAAILLMCMLVGLVPVPAAYAQELSPEMMPEQILEISPDQIPSQETCAHSYALSVTSPACEAQGYTTYTCTLCGGNYVDAYTSALGHSWDGGVETLAPTETATGVKTYTCTVCLATKQEDIPAIIPAPSCEHSAQTLAAVAPTCGNAGLTEGSVCALCGVTLLAQQEVPALGHSYADGICIVCGAELTQPEQSLLSVPVRFVCFSETLELTVFDANAQQLKPEHDGSYLLTPGTYIYFAYCDGYASLDNQVLTLSEEGYLSVNDVILPYVEEYEVEITLTRTEPVPTPAVEAVTVSFNSSPAELNLSVYATPEETVPAQADGTYLLMPGYYAYSAACEGYIGVELVPFEVVSGSGSMSIDVTLEEIPTEPELPVPVRVEFNCTPAETLVWVADEFDNEYEPEADGSFLLMPGNYYYVAFCEGYVGIEEELIIENGSAPISIDVVMEEDEDPEVAATYDT